MKSFRQISIPASVAILTHIYAYGPPHKLLNYMLQKEVAKIHFIGNPFSFAKDTRSYYKFYKNSKLVKESYSLRFKAPDMIIYLRDFLYFLFWGLIMDKVEILICFDGFSTFAGNMLKKLGKAQYLVFYTIDYAPIRFKNSLLNRIYLWLDNFALRKADAIWNLSGEMSRMRVKSGLDSKYLRKQIIVPIGVEEIFSPKKLTRESRFKIAFIGHLKRKQGLEKLIGVMPKVIEKLPNASLIIVGGGILENKLKLLAKRINLGERIIFTGYLEDYKNVLDILRNCAVGVAPYKDDKETYTRFADPTKPKDYLACGLPVVITKVPAIYKYIEEKECGIAINDSRKELVDAIVYLLKNKKRLDFYKNNAYKAIKKFENEKVYDKAFQKSIKLFIS